MAGCFDQVTGIVFVVGILRGSRTFYVDLDNLSNRGGTWYVGDACILGVISEVGQEYAFVREVTYWLAIGNRTNNFIKGLIGSEDVLYFVILSCMFLEFAILKMQLKRERCSFLNKTVRYLGVFMIAMLLGYFTSRPVLKFYHDSTFNKINTLTQASQDIVSKLDGGLTITTYVNLMDMNYSINHKRITRDMAVTNDLFVLSRK